MIRFVSKKNRTIRQADKESWLPLLHFSKTCITGFIYCRLLYLFLQILNQNYSILYNKLYISSLLLASFFYFLGKISIYFKKKFFSKKTIIQRIDEDNNQPKIPKLKKQQDIQYWHRLLKPYVIFIPGFLIGQLFSMILMVINKDFSFVTNRVQQIFLLILLSIACLYGTLYYISSSHKRSHQTIREQRYNFFRTVVNFIFLAIPRIVIGIILEIIKLENLEIFYNRDQQVFIGILFFVYLGFALFKYIEWKMKYEPTIHRVTNLLNSMYSDAIKESNLEKILTNQNFINNLYMMYQIVYRENSDVEYIKEDSTLDSNELFHLLNIIKVHSEIEVDPQKYRIQIEYIAYNIKHNKSIQIGKKSSIAGFLEVIIEDANSKAKNSMQIETINAFEILGLDNR